jgi:hypothetical protein
MLPLTGHRINPSRTAVNCSGAALTKHPSGALNRQVHTAWYGTMGSCAGGAYPPWADTANDEGKP